RPLSRPAHPASYPLALHDALPICEIGRTAQNFRQRGTQDVEHRLRGLARGLGRRLLEHRLERLRRALLPAARQIPAHAALELARSEEHTSELQSRVDLVCRLLLEK